MSDDTTYWLDRINDLESDNLSLLVRNINLLADNNALEVRLAECKALIERLIEAGDEVHRVATIYRDGDEFDEVAEWERIVTEYQATSAKGTK